MGLVSLLEFAVALNALKLDDFMEKTNFGFQCNGLEHLHRVPDVAYLSKQQIWHGLETMKALGVFVQWWVGLICDSMLQLSFLE